MKRHSKTIQLLIDLASGIQFLNQSQKHPAAEKIISWNRSFRQNWCSIFVRTQRTHSLIRVFFVPVEKFEFDEKVESFALCGKNSHLFHLKNMLFEKNKSSQIAKKKIKGYLAILTNFVSEVF